jgi:hypothetical protein
MAVARAAFLLAVSAGCGRVGYEPIEDTAGSSCQGPDEGTVALYPFDSDGGTSRITDAVGANHGVSNDPLATTAGPAGCGDALSFPAPTPIVIADDPDWQLFEGSLDLWIRQEAPATQSMGLVTRDALGTELPGHFSLMLDGGDRVFVRIQDLEVDSVPHTLICANQPLDIGRWTRVGVNFGPPRNELWIDGQPQAGTGSVRFGATNTHDCGPVATGGIAGNNNPWVVGASSHGSEEGESEALLAPLTGVSLDHLRISSIRRDYSLDLSTLDRRAKQ